MNRRLLICGVVAVSFKLTVAADAGFLVRDGQAGSEIVVAADASRTTRLAGQELQRYVEKITGAKLPIVDRPSNDNRVEVFVGQSEFTERLNVSAEGLSCGAYRIASGDRWLVLMGDDSEFEPIEPWPRSNTDWVSGRVHAEWDKITGATWGNPMAQLRKHYTGRTFDYGTPDHATTDEQGRVHVWGFDERGSFNAVCGFLHSLGVRWYMPGEIGEVVPSLRSIPLPVIDQTVRPDFPVRRFNFRFGVHGSETADWAMRLGIRDPYGLQIAHGMHAMTHRDEILEMHPDWFALYGGRRHNQPGQRVNQLCYSNEELFQETLRYVRAMYDHYQYDVVSVMPPDGYVSICQCPLCEGKDTPERDYRGRLSDYVWDFVNRVAKEIQKTHPDKMVSNCAYGAYTLPPLKIDQLESNVLVCLVGGRRPANSRPEQQEEIRRLRESWSAKTPNRIMIFENYPFTDRGWYLPTFVPHVIGEGINATKDMSQGEDIWLSVRQDFPDVAIGFNHFLVYFTARMYWGGKQQSVDPLFDEYCRLFYGPAGMEMKAFFEYCEQHWQEMENDKVPVDRALALFDSAKAKSPADSLYARRIALIDDYLQALRNKGEQLAKQRGPVPQLRLARDAQGIVIDGRLDDAFWQQAPVHATGRLRELQTGRQPTYPTTFQAAWGKDGSLYFAIRCEEHRGESLNVGTIRSEDQALWYGDAVEILLESDSHSYYQLAINPAGAMIDLDRGASKKAWYGWDSQAEVATQVADDHWTAELRVPVVQDGNDPLHQVVGRKPTSSLPWHFNVCRQRIRENGAEHSAFSPTGTAGFHAPMKFAQLYEGQSHRFDSDDSVSDYILSRQATLKKITPQDAADALDTFKSLASEAVSDLQKSDALEQAAACARALDQQDLADDLARQIPIAAVAKAVCMKNLSSRREYAQLLEAFREEKIGEWPFWKRGDGFYLRGIAFSNLGEGERADSDLRAALEYTTDHRVRLDIWLAIGTNQEKNLQNSAAALKAYELIAESIRNNGSATYYRGVQNAARLHRQAGRVDAALAALGKVDVSKLRGYWHGSMLVQLGKTLLEAGRADEAVKAYREALADPAISGGDRREAEEAVAEIEK